MVDDDRLRERRPELGEDLVPTDPRPSIVRTLLGVVVGVAGFTLLLVQLYRYDFPLEFRTRMIILLAIGTAFLLAGRSLGAFGNRLLLLFLLLLFAVLWLYAQIAYGFYADFWNAGTKGG